MKINHNIPALRTYHALSKTNNLLEKTMERLSSGLRINRAADDAAGLAIAQKMDTQVRGLKMAKRNSMDGVSLVQTAEGALNEVGAMLQRMRELSIQGANGTLAATDRKAIQDEVAQLREEIIKISDTTEFNEMKLLNGDLDRRGFSTNGNFADIVYTSESVEAGHYMFKVNQEPTKTGDEGGLISAKMFDAEGKSKLVGKITINGEVVEVSEGDTKQQIFGKIRDVCESVDISVQCLDSNNERTTLDAGTRLQFEVNTYGEQKLEILGDSNLLQALGLDSTQFQPQTDTLYVSEICPSALGVPSVTGSFMINEKEITILSTDTDDMIYEKIKNANIKGVEVTRVEPDTGMAVDYITKVYSPKPLIIKPVTTGTAAEIANSQTLANEFSSLSATSTIKETEVKNIGINTISDISNPGYIVVKKNGVKLTHFTTVPAPTILGAINISPTEWSLDADGKLTNDLNFLSNMNMIYGNWLPEGEKITFAFVDNGTRLAAYSQDGSQITIEPADISNVDDRNLAQALGFEETHVESIFGNKGHDVQVDTKSTMSTGSAFSPSTTIATEGERITFTDTNGFKMIVDTKGDKSQLLNPENGLLSVNILDSGQLQLQIGANEGINLKIQIPKISDKSLGIDRINLGTTQGCTKAIGILDEAINQISNIRSKLGAYQNRLEHTIANLETTDENMTASLSRIEDADMAEEMAEYTQKNIISQAGISMLAQANQRPQSILQLLQG